MEPDTFEQGFTPFCNTLKVYQDLDSHLKDKLTKYGIKYEQNLDCINSNNIDKLDDGWKTWNGLFNVKRKEECENMCNIMGYNYKWKKNDRLFIECIKPAFVKHVETNTLSFANDITSMHGSIFSKIENWAKIAKSERPYHSKYGNNDEFTNE